MHEAVHRSDVMKEAIRVTACTKPFKDTIKRNRSLAA